MPMPPEEKRRLADAIRRMEADGVPPEQIRSATQKWSAKFDHAPVAPSAPPQGDAPMSIGDFIGGVKDTLLEDMPKGALKAAGNTFSHLGAGADWFADKVMPNRMLYGDKGNSEAFEEGRPAYALTGDTEGLTPKNAGQKVGYAAERVAEAAIPASSVSKAAKALQIANRFARLGVNAGIGAVEGAAIGGAQEGTEGAEAGGVLGGALPVVGAALRTGGRALVKSRIRPNQNLSSEALKMAEALNVNPIQEVISTPGVGRTSGKAAREVIDKAGASAAGEADDIVDSYGGSQVDVKATLSEMRGKLAEAERLGLPGTAGLRKVVTRLEAKLAGMEGDRIPARVALEAKRDLQKTASATGAYARTPISEDTVSQGIAASKAGAGFRRGLEETLPEIVAPERRSFGLQLASEAMESADDKITQQEWMKGSIPRTIVHNARRLTDPIKLPLGRAAYKLGGGSDYALSPAAQAAVAQARRMRGTGDQVFQGDRVPEEFVHQVAPAEGPKRGFDEGADAAFPLAPADDIQLSTDPDFSAELTGNPVNKAKVAAAQAELDALMEQGMTPSERARRAREISDRLRENIAAGEEMQYGTSPSIRSRTAAFTDANTPNKSYGPFIVPEETPSNVRSTKKLEHGQEVSHTLRNMETREAAPEPWHVPQTREQMERLVRDRKDMARSKARGLAARVTDTQIKAALAKSGGNANTAAGQLGISVDQLIDILADAAKQKGAR